MQREPEDRSAREYANFASTQWSQVFAAAHSSWPGARQALESLCARYWFPLYGWLRRQGWSEHDAQDLTQGFFADLLNRHSLGDVRPQLGKFRSFLLASLQHFAANERLKQRAIKRGGGQPVFHINFANAENEYTQATAPELTPDEAFERQWALSVLATAMQTVLREQADAGREAWFNAVKPLLWADNDAPSYAEVARQQGLSVGALKVAVHRLRRRYRQVLRAEVALTLAPGDDVETELKALVTATRAKN